MVVRYIINGIYFYDAWGARQTAEFWESTLYRQQGWPKGDGTNRWEAPTVEWARY